MDMLSEKEKQERLEMAGSESLLYDMRRLKAVSKNAFVRDGKTDIDLYIEFLNAYNDFINHRQKPFKRIKESKMIL